MLGQQQHGQLGNGTTANSALPVKVVGLRNQAIAIGAGAFGTSSGPGGHACALLNGGTVKCWGLNANGELGDGTTTDRLTPVQVIGLNASITSVKPGGAHTCALTSTGGVKCWGSNIAGQLGDGTTTDRHTPVDVIGLSSGVTQIASGGFHTCALTTAGGVKCWGANGSGELGDGSEIDRHTPFDVSGLSGGVAAIAAGYKHTCALMISGGAKCWGDNSLYQTGHGKRDRPRVVPVDVLGLSNAIGISAGAAHTCVALRSGAAKCWGANDDGQLGDGTLTNSPHAVRVLRLRGVSAVYGGSDHSCALLQSNVMKCWGDNSSGELGDGTSNPSGVPVRVRRF